MTRLADDEGRFKVYPAALAERFLATVDTESVADIETALQCAEEAGILRRYGPNDQFAWFPGWFEHQNIQAERRSESSLPPPPGQPGDIVSWADADKARQAMAEALGRNLQQIRSDDAVRWFANNRLTDRIQTVDESSTSGLPDVTGLDRTRLDNNPLSETGAKTVSDDAKPETKAEKQKRLNTNEAKLREVFSQSELVLVDAFLDVAASENKTNQITQGRTITLLEELKSAKDEIGCEGFVTGLRAANSAGAPNVNYVKKAALSQMRAGKSGSTIAARGDVDYGPAGRIKM